MTLHLFLIDLEALMRQALQTAMLVAAVILLGGVLFGWEYALFLGFVIVLALQMIRMARK